MLKDKNISLHYEKNISAIRMRLNDFRNIQREDYFYELCFCLCTPQSKAANALQVQNKLKAADIYNTFLNPVSILADKNHYIRFHNQKAKRILELIPKFPKIMGILDSEATPAEKRLEIYRNITGFGMKEASHFMRNIGYSRLAILDRHILKNLVKLGVFATVPNISSVKNYLAIESEFLNFADEAGIPVDELDLLFWSYENGEIIK